MQPNYVANYVAKKLNLIKPKLSLFFEGKGCFVM